MLELNVQDALGVVSSVLFFTSFALYIHGILFKGLEPHPYTWVLLSLLAATAIKVQFDTDARVTAMLPLIIDMICCAIVFALSIKKGAKHIELLDGIYLLAALMALTLSVFTAHDLVGVWLAAVTNVFALAPTWRKTARAPNTEAFICHLLVAIGAVFAIAAHGGFERQEKWLYLAAVLFTSSVSSIVCFVFQAKLKR